MKTYLALLIAAIALLLSGCATATQKNAGAFLAKVASMNLDFNDVTQKTITPIYNHSESITAFHHDPKTFSVANLKAEFNSPFPVMNIPLLHWELSASGGSGQFPDPKLLAGIAAAGPVSSNTSGTK